MVLTIFCSLGKLFLYISLWLVVSGLYIVFMLYPSAADQARIMEEQMSGAAMAMPQDPKAAFKAEWEALEIAEHKWALKDVESDLLQKAEVDYLVNSQSFVNNS